MYKQNKKVKIFSNFDDISEFLINEWIINQNNALSDKGYFSVALSGGNTPIPFYQKLSEQKNKFNWKKTYIFIVDERYVPFTHKDNNYKMIKENLLNKISIPENNVFTINTHLPIIESVIDYEKQIIFFFKNEKYPSFDLILLGIGKDGHTASLFPDNQVLNEKTKFVAPVEDKKINLKRITLTYPILNNAKKIIFLATGENKTEVIKEIIKNRNKKYPASNINPKQGELLFVIDKNAGKKLINTS